MNPKKRKHFHKQRPKAEQKTNELRSSILPTYNQSWQGHGWQERSNPANAIKECYLDNIALLRRGIA